MTSRDEKIFIYFSSFAIKLNLPTRIGLSARSRQEEGLACFKVLDQDGRVVGSGSTVDQAIRDAASKMGRLPWDGFEGPTAEEVVRELVQAGDYSLALP
jgi:hypothetical protein